MRNRFDQGGDPDLKVVVAEYRDLMTKRLRWIGPGLAGLVLLLLMWGGVYSVNPGEVGVVRTFGKETGQTPPGLHFVIPLMQRVDIINTTTIRRVEIGFRSSAQGAKRIDAEALMLTGDENIIEAQMIVQYQVQDPSKYLFALHNPEKVLHVAAEVALRDVVGQMNVTSNIQELDSGVHHEKKDDAKKDDAKKDDAKKDDAKKDDAKKDDAKKDDAKDPKGAKAIPAKAAEPDASETDILTKGRERAQVRTRAMLQELMDLYDSGLKITEVKLQAVDAPDEVKDAFHDVVRAREEREQMINKALGYREDRLPKARGQKQKIIRAAEAYRAERVLRAEGEAKRFGAILAEYRKARRVTRERLHLETIERILQSVPKKVLIDKNVAKNALPVLPLGANVVGAQQGGQR